jgi:transcriptional regulator with XRE-family HTH domain
MINSRIQSNRNLREFGKRLSAYRIAAGISRDNLAKSISVSPQHIWRLEINTFGTLPGKEKGRHSEKHSSFK